MLQKRAFSRPSKKRLNKKIKIPLIFQPESSLNNFEEVFRGRLIGSIFRPRSNLNRNRLETVYCGRTKHTQQQFIAVKTTHSLRRRNNKKSKHICKFIFSLWLFLISSRGKLESQNKTYSYAIREEFRSKTPQNLNDFKKASMHGKRAKTKRGKTTFCRMKFYLTMILCIF